MKRKLTITVSSDVYEGLQAKVGVRRISQFLENLARPHVIPFSLEEGYRLAALDEEDSREALEWADGLIGDAY